MKEISRKHFRFPAYDDETGVKLEKNQKRVLFDGQDDLLTEMNSQPLFEQMQEFHFAKNEGKEQRKRRNLSKSNKKNPKEELVYRKEKLSDYRVPTNNETFVQPHSKTTKGTTSKQSNQKHSMGRSYTENPKNPGRERTYFVPKYVPASIIPDPKTRKISENELVRSMKKSKDSYLLFDNELVPYQEKKVGEPSVKPFNKVEKEPLNQRKKEKGHGVLERSLQGLIEDQGNSLEENSYFK